MNILSPHIPFTELVDLADEKTTRSDEVREHLTACSHCATQLEKLRQTIGLMRSDTTEEPPEEIVEAARKFFRSPAVSREPSLVKRVVASLTFDSFTAAPAFGLRSQTSGGRQLIYSTETADIEVRVSPENEVAGQILGPTCTDGDVSLESKSFSASAQLNELCEFSFGAVPAGTYKISVRLPNLLVETPELELGP
jgi:anti-sigma factor RsiW